jgi:hypothetical protein
VRNSMPVAVTLACCRLAALVVPVPVNAGQEKPWLVLARY